MTKYQISIIIPTLNEAENIDFLLCHLIANSKPENISEISVVDGGSTDGTQDLINNFASSYDFEQSEKSYREIDNPDLEYTHPKILLITSQKGRAKQMNVGAKTAKGNILYFLHADSLPPKSFDQLIINEVNKGNLAGCFRLQFNHTHWWLRLASWLTQFNWRACRGGDQSQFITKTLFNDIGGFNESYIIYEDNILITELYKRKQFKVINKKLMTSARRYKEHGIWKLQYHFWTIYIKKWFGASAEELHTYYKKYIAL